MEIKIYNKLHHDAKLIRDEVFVKEQGFTDEYDEADNIAAHIVIYDGDTPISTCRLFHKGDGVYMFGRMAVRIEFRKNGIGSKTVAAAEDFARSKGGKKIILHAQLQARDFYRHCGYREYGEIECEQDCPHIWMSKEL